MLYRKIKQFVLHPTENKSTQLCGQNVDFYKCKIWWCIKQLGFEWLNGVVYKLDTLCPLTLA